MEVANFQWSKAWIQIMVPIGVSRVGVEKCHN